MRAFISGLLLAIAFAGTFFTDSARAQDAQSVPALVVLSSDQPKYPMIAIQMHIQGTVRLKVRTDGNKAVKFLEYSGPAMLVVAAEENVNSWRFQPGGPTEFETTFRYVLRPEASCTVDPADTKATQNLPTEVEIITKTFRCDPPPIDPTKPVRVQLTVKLNGKEIPPPVEVVLTVGMNTIHSRLTDGKFEVPPSVFLAEEVDFSTAVGRDHIFIPSLSGFRFTDDPWILNLADRQFEDGQHTGDFIGIKTNTICILEFDSHYGDGVEETVTNCRTRERSAPSESQVKSLPLSSNQREVDDNALRAVSLKIKRNGLTVTPPKEFQFEIIGKSLQVTSEKDRIQIPPEIMKEKGDIWFSFDLDGERVKFQVVNSDLRKPKWTIILADKEHKNLFPNHKFFDDIESRCAVLFEPRLIRAEALGFIYTNCRQKKSN